MQPIINFFTGIADFFVSIVDFVVGFFKDLIYVITLVDSFVKALPGYFAWLPSAALILILAIFSIVIVYLILGRQ